MKILVVFFVIVIAFGAKYGSTIEGKTIQLVSIGSDGCDGRVVSQCAEVQFQFYLNDLYFIKLSPLKKQRQAQSWIANAGLECQINEMQQPIHCFNLLNTLPRILLSGQGCIGNYFQLWEDMFPLKTLFNMVLEWFQKR